MMKTNKLTKGSNLRWESSRMMLPEHVEAINQHRGDLKRVKQPILDEQEIEEISRKLGESLTEYVPISLSLYKAGFIEVISGIVQKLDQGSREITLSDYEHEHHKITFDNIVSVDVH
jgi:hypothetical protein